MFEEVVFFSLLTGIFIFLCILRSCIKDEDCKDEFIPSP